MAIPNIGVEFYLGAGWSVGASWMYAWWSAGKRNRYWRVYGGEIYGRYHFGNHTNRFKGHHVGIYAGLVTYDFEFGGVGYIGGKPGHSLWDRCMRNFGAEYGYSFAIARNLYIDLTLGVGYFGGIEEKLRPIQGEYYWESTSRKTWLGPTKAEVSFVWVIFGGSAKAKKGGDK